MANTRSIFMSIFKVKISRLVISSFFLFERVVNISANRCECGPTDQKEVTSHLFPLRMEEDGGEKKFK